MAATRVPVTPAVLKWARESSGLSITDAAQQIGIASDRISAFERGADQPTITTARNLARVYRRPVAALLLPRPPAEEDTPVDFRQGTGAVQLGPASRIAIREAARVQTAAAELFDALDIVPDWRTGSLNTRSDVGKVATEIRERLGISTAAQLRWPDARVAFTSWRSALGDSGVLVLQRAFPTAEARGFSLAAASPPTVVVNRSDAITARSFTLFHELGHILLGTGGLCLPEATLQPLLQVPEEETFCNALAGEVLVPTPALLRDEQALSVVRKHAIPSDAELAGLARRFGVSMQVFWWRLRDVGYVASVDYGTKWAQWRSRTYEGSRRTAASGGGESAVDRTLHENSRTFVTAVLEARTRGLLGMDQVIDWLGVRYKDVHVLEERLSGSPRG